LATAYAQRISGNEPLPPQTKQAFQKTISHNPGFALVTSLFYSFFGEVPPVGPPPLANQSVIVVRINYKWTGLGQNVSYSVIITHADSKPVVSANVIPQSLAIDLNLKNLDKSLVEQLT
jgi:hypothetical protein